MHQSTPAQMFTSHPDVLGAQHLSPGTVKRGLKALPVGASDLAAVSCSRTAARVAAVLLMLNGKSS